MQKSEIFINKILLMLNDCNISNYSLKEISCVLSDAPNSGINAAPSKIYTSSELLEMNNSR